MCDVDICSTVCTQRVYRMYVVCASRCEAIVIVLESSGSEIWAGIKCKFPCQYIRVFGNIIVRVPYWYISMQKNLYMHTGNTLAHMFTSGSGGGGSGSRYSVFYREIHVPVWLD